MELKKLIMIWFTVGIIAAFIGFGAIVTPGVNFVAGVPTMLMIMAVNLGFFLAVMWKWINQPDKPKNKVSQDGGLMGNVMGNNTGCVECCNSGSYDDNYECEDPQNPGNWGPEFC